MSTIVRNKYSISYYRRKCAQDEIQEFCGENVTINTQTVGAYYTAMLSVNGRYKTETRYYSTRSSLGGGRWKKT